MAIVTFGYFLVNFSNECIELEHTVTLGNVISTKNIYKKIRIYAIIHTRAIVLFNKYGPKSQIMTNMRWYGLWFFFVIKQGLIYVFYFINKNSFKFYCICNNIFADSSIFQLQVERWRNFRKYYYKYNKKLKEFLFMKLNYNVPNTRNYIWMSP